MINRAGFEKKNTFDTHEEKTVKEYSSTLASLLAFLGAVGKTFAEAVKEPLGAPDVTVVQFLLHEAAHNHKYVFAFHSVFICDTLVRYRCPDNMQHGAMHLQRAFR